MFTNSTIGSSGEIMEGVVILFYRLKGNIEAKAAIQWWVSICP